MSAPMVAFAVNQLAGVQLLSVAAALIPYFILDEKMEEEEAVNQAMRVGLRSSEMLEWGLDYARRNQKIE